MKHGLRAELPIIPGEDPDALQRRRDAWAADLQPQTDVERYLIDTAVNASWRMDRCRRAEAAALARNGCDRASAKVFGGNRPIFCPRPLSVVMLDGRGT